jgi:hypothetical protein
MIDFFNVLPLHGILGGIAAGALALLLAFIGACAILGIGFAVLWITRLFGNRSEFVGREIPRSTSITVANSQLNFENSLAAGWREAEQLTMKACVDIADLECELSKLRSELNAIRREP